MPTDKQASEMSIIFCILVPLYYLWARRVNVQLLLLMYIFCGFYSIILSNLFVLAFGKDGFIRPSSSLNAINSVRLLLTDLFSYIWNFLFFSFFFFFFFFSQRPERDVENAINTMRKRKTSGLNNITVDLLRDAGELSPQKLSYFPQYNTHRRMRLDWKVHMMSYLLLMNFITIGIQPLQHWWKKSVDCKEEK